MQTRKDRMPIRLRLTCDISRSHYQYQGAAVKGMLSKLPLEVDVLPDMFFHIFGQMVLGESLYYKYLREVGGETYEELYKEINAEKKNEDS